MTEGIADFNAFYRRYAPDVFRFALYLSGERSDAEDITSETFVRIWTSSAKIDATTVRAYLFTIARNLHLESVRTRRRDVVLDDDFGDPLPGPYAQAAARSDVTAVEKGMMRLQEKDRAALLLRAVDGMTYEEIARTLGISLASAKVKVHRARLALAHIR